MQGVTRVFRKFPLDVTLAAAALATFWLGADASAQTLERYAVPRTSWGDPDLTGIWPGTAMTGVPLQRDAHVGTRRHRGECAGEQDGEQHGQDADSVNSWPHHAWAPKSLC